MAATGYLLAGQLSELDMRAAEHAALVAAVHVAHQRELAMTEARLGYASFLSLLEAGDDETEHQFGIKSFVGELLRGQAKQAAER